MGGAVPTNAALIPQRSGESLTKGDSSVFNRVMQIDFNIPIRLDPEIAQAVARKEHQHVIEKRYLRLHLAVAAPVDEQIESDIRLTGDTFDSGAAVHG
jgi:hypothetical protein